MNTPAPTGAPAPASRNRTKSSRMQATRTLLPLGNNKENFNQTVKALTKLIEKNKRY